MSWASEACRQLKVSSSSTSTVTRLMSRSILSISYLTWMREIYFAHLRFRRDHTLSIGFKGLEYGGVNNKVKPVSCAYSVTSFDLWAEWLSRTITIVYGGTFVDWIMLYRKFFTSLLLVVGQIVNLLLKCWSSPPITPITVCFFPAVDW